MSGPRRLLLCALFSVLSFSGSPSSVEGAESALARIGGVHQLSHIAEGVHQLINRVHAATSGTAITKLQDVPVGKVIQVGFVKFVKAADDAYIATDKVECPDKSWFAGKYVKCWDSEDEYTQTCTGSYYCGTNTSWDSTNKVCTGTGGSNYCGNGTTWDATTSKCKIITCGNHAHATSAACACDSGYYADASGSTDTTVDGSCTYQKCTGSNVSTTYTNNSQCTCTTNYYADSSGATYTTPTGTCSYSKCSGTNVNTSTYTNNNSCSCNSGWYASGSTSSTTTSNGGACRYRYVCSTWWYQTEGTYTWANRNDAGCPSGYSIPTADQFKSCIGTTGNNNSYTVTGTEWGGTGYYWSSTDYGSTYAYRLGVTSSYSNVYDYGKADSLYVRCRKN